MTIGIYAGSFDPFTIGHLDVVKRSMTFCKKLIVAVGSNTAKKTMFGTADRIDMVHNSINQEVDFLTSTNIDVDYFSGLLVDYARQKGASLLIRGVRTGTDFEYETNLANINKKLAPELDTIFVPTRLELSIVSSSMVRELSLHKADYSAYVPKAVHEHMQKVAAKTSP